MARTVTLKSELRVADEVWIATALLHRENPGRPDFTVLEIEARARRERMTEEPRKGVYPHASLHCVANRPANPARHRMLYATGKARRRLFRDGDDFHPSRALGRLRPERENIPALYHFLLDWYDKGMSMRPLGPDPLLALQGSGKALWADEAADSYLRRLREGW